MTNSLHEAQAAQELLEAGLAASRRNESGQALALFARAGSVAPGWALPHFLAGSEHASLGQWELAEAELANAVLLEPSLQIARYQLGLLQFSGGRPAIALLTWKPLVDEPADPGLAEFVLGFAALARDDFEAAHASFLRGLALPGVNAAVAQDVQLVLSRIPGARAAPSHTPNPHAETLVLSEHVLVANYGKFNLH